MRREIREALQLEKPMILACIDGLLPPQDLPEDIKQITQIQGVKFYREYFKAGVERLSDFIAKATPIRIKGEKLTVSSEGRRATLDEAIQFMNEENYEKAIPLFKDLIANGYRSRFVDIQSLLKQAETLFSALSYYKEAAKRYSEIAKMPRTPDTIGNAQVAFKLLCEEFPEFNKSENDPENLRYELADPNSFVAPYKPGKRVYHAKFGEGTVIASRADGKDIEVQVKFGKYGMKLLAASFANLVILDK